MPRAQGDVRGDAPTDARLRGARHTGRLPPVDAGAATILAGRTPGDLRDERPTWPANARRGLDGAVAPARPRPPARRGGLLVAAGIEHSHREPAP